ncbi:N-formylglutamate amidohydrolase [Amaricoccus sp.]|uniref:N-formylglutamate amidohydrolase n=1 Tax=Amaricoccus sp. TaxID=1872485 RepID=UPI00260A5BA6|nr:N-formylglutamate amidohydrolase [Amaricoccus sp.]HRO12245.1 N-formylglutamate amidohydrolase [Amaricoccus sp.]
MDERAYEEVGGAPGSRLLLLCDHATNRVPASVAGGDLGLPPEEMARHIAYDIGARGVALELARIMAAPALLTRFSRLVIDPNRGEDDPTLVMRLYDGTLIPANRQVTAAEVERRLDAFHRPYHRAIDAAIERMGEPALVSIHSYTPQLKGRPLRPWQVGILWHRDGRLAGPLLQRLRGQGYCVGDNEPYSGELEGDTMSRHGTARGLAHVLIELRQDLVATPEAQALWAGRLAPIIAGAIGEMADG